MYKQKRGIVVSATMPRYDLSNYMTLFSDSYIPYHYG